MNLIRNPDEPLEALALTQRLLALDEQGIPPESTAIDIGGNNWGSVMSVPQSNLTSGAWSYSALVQTELASAETRLCSPDASFVDRLHVAELKSLADLGPYHIQVKNPDQGLFSIVETREILRAGIPALWHHKSTYNITLEATADSRLERRTDRDRAE